MQTRFSTLAEVRVLSLASLLYASRSADSITGNETTAAEVEKQLKELRKALGQGPGVLQSKNSTIFKTVGLARQVRIDEDYGTQNIYGIGAPTRPRIIPNNFSANVTVDRLQLDTRNLSHYIATPEYWYSTDVQRQIGIDDYLLYTYFFVRSKEDVGKTGVRYDIYALMPRSASVTQSSSDVMVVHNVSLTGFKYSYEEFYFDSSNLINDSLTWDIGFTSNGAATGSGEGTAARLEQ